MNTIRLLSALLLLTTAVSAQEALAPLEFMIGEWRGTSRGTPGEGTVHRVCEKVLRDRFIECRTTVTYEKEVHVDRALFSYDKSAKKLRMRQFHGEGFVNTYEGEGLVFVTTAIENIAAGWRARETYKQPSADVWEEVFELAAPDKDFAVYSASTLRRAK